MRQRLGIPGLLAMMGCGSVPAGESVELSFAARVGEVDFECGETYSDLGSSSSSLTLHDFRLYVHDIELLREDETGVPLTLRETDWQTEGVALLDFATGTGPCSTNVETNTAIVGTIESGEYIGIRLTIGVPPDLNHGNASVAVSPLNLTSMWWTWNDGYKFIRMDGPTSELENWRFHLGSTLCEGEAREEEEVVCDNPNRPTITLTSFDPLETTILVDLAGLLDSVDLAQNAEGTPEGCMGDTDDPDCENYFRNLGLPWDSASSAGQLFLRVEE